MSIAMRRSCIVCGGTHNPKRMSSTSLRGEVVWLCRQCEVRVRQRQAKSRWVGTDRVMRQRPERGGSMS